MNQYRNLRKRWAFVVGKQGTHRQDLKALLQSCDESQLKAAELLGEWVEKWVNLIGSHEVVNALLVDIFATVADNMEPPEDQYPLPIFD